MCAMTNSDECNDIHSMVIATWPARFEFPRLGGHVPASNSAEPGLPTTQ
jgi:hypothetical protein